MSSASVASSRSRNPASPSISNIVGIDTPSRCSSSTSASTNRLPQAPRELAPERGLARTGQADQKQIAPVQRNRGIGVEVAARASPVVAFTAPR